MTGARWLVVLAACGGSGGLQDRPPPPPEATCRSAGQHLIELVLAAQKEPPPDEAVNKLIARVATHCEADAWSAEARACFSRVTSFEAADACAKTLTEAQLTALSADMAPPAD